MRSKQNYEVFAVPLQSEEGRCQPAIVPAGLAKPYAAYLSIQLIQMKFTAESSADAARLSGGLSQPLKYFMRIFVGIFWNCVPKSSYMSCRTKTNNFKVDRVKMSSARML